MLKLLCYSKHHQERGYLIMKEITEYFRNALIARSQGLCDYNEKNFPISNEDLKKGTLDINVLINNFLTDKNGNIIQSGDIIIVLKTLIIPYKDGAKTDNNKEDKYSLFLLPAKFELNNQKKKLKLFPNTDKNPWFPREFMQPFIDPTISIGDIENYDRFLEKKTVKRTQIGNNWSKYLNYSFELYKEITGFDINDQENILKDQAIKFDENIYVFSDSDMNMTRHIQNLYNDLLKNPENQLYSELTNGIPKQTKPLISNSDISKMKLHVGQMNGSYPLSPSQRESINHYNTLKEGDILAISDPPGTGKTTLLQSIVADYFVKAALKQEDAPIIVATSTNNQAVTNIIDFFGKIESIFSSNLEKRWLNDVHSFATFFASSEKIKNNKNKNYQFYTNDENFKKSDFFKNMNDKLKNHELNNYFFKHYNNFFNDTHKNDLESCLKKLYDHLISIHKNIEKLISKISSIKSILNENSYKKYLTTNLNKKADLNNLIKQKKNEINLINQDKQKYLNRLNEWNNSYNKNFPVYFRIFRFFPSISRKIELWTSTFINLEEINFLDRHMSISEVRAVYNKKIDDNIQIIKNKSTDLKKLLENINEIDIKLSEINSQMLDYLNNIDIFNKKYQFKNYKSLLSTKEWENYGILDLNDLLDRYRYIEFWVAVHYFECKWLLKKPISDTRINATYENILYEKYHNLAMISPCFVMTFFMLPKYFRAYTDDKQHKYLYNFIDLLIIDEAGQTSPELAAPSFSLAKKAIVVGDEEQIPPVWGTAKLLDQSMAFTHNVIRNKEEFELLIKNGLNCSESSIMKVAKYCTAFNKNNSRGLFLSEHRRCYNEIIQYCNELVYNGKLEPKRGSFNTDKNPIKDFLSPMTHIQVTVSKSEKTNYSRKNELEAEAIINWIKKNFLKLCEMYCYSESSIDKRMILGIITPFKSQVHTINRLLKTSYINNENYETYADFIDVGTVHSFQGGERKIIIFSTVYGNQDNWYFINEHVHLMNVAVSRAKDAFIVFGDRDLVDDEKKPSRLLQSMYIDLC